MRQAPSISAAYAMRPPVGLNVGGACWEKSENAGPREPSTPIRTLIEVPHARHVGDVQPVGLKRMRLPSDPNGTTASSSGPVSPSQ